MKVKEEEESDSVARTPKSAQKYGIVIITSVTRLGDLLDFGQLFKACGNN